MPKACLYRSCKNHSKSQNWDIINKKIFFLPIPKCRKDPTKCKIWVKAVNRDDITVDTLKKYHYICSKHFVGGNGPTTEYPDPIPDCYSGIPKKRKLLKDKAKVETKNTDVSSVNVDCAELISYAGEAPEEYIKSSTSSYIQDEACEFKNILSISGEKIEDCHLSQQNSTCQFPSKIYSSPPLLPSCVEHPSTTISRIIILSEARNPLEKIIQDFLIYQVSNLRTVFWCLDLKCYTNLDDNNITIAFKKSVDERLFIRLELTSSMMVSVRPLNKELTESGVHDLITSKGVNIKEPISSIKDLLTIMDEIDQWKICCGVRDELSLTCKNEFFKSSHYCEISDSIRSIECQNLFQSKLTNLCQPCRNTKRYLQKRLKQAKLMSNKTKGNALSNIKTGVNIRYMSRKEMRKLMLAMKIKNKVLKQKVKTMQNKI